MLTRPLLPMRWGGGPDAEHMGGLAREEADESDWEPIDHPPLEPR